MFESIFVCYVVVRVLWYVLCFTYNKKKDKKKKNYFSIIERKLRSFQIKLNL